MSEVKVNREIFDALESTKEWEVTEERRLELIMNYYSTKSFVGKRRIINKLNLKLFLDILRFGYELELTPHEKVLENYNKLKKEIELSLDPNLKRELYNCIEVMKITLDNLEVYIEGVNK